MTARILTLLGVAIGLAGCAPTSGVITLAVGRSPATVADIQYVSADGRETSFNQVRYSTTIVAFSSTEGANCCAIDPRVVQIADQVWELPVTVAQISIPNGKCPHGSGCVEACNLREGGLMSLCDADRLAWEVYGQPVSGKLFLINAQSEVLMTGDISDPKAVVEGARTVARSFDQRRDRLDGPEIW